MVKKVAVIAVNPVNGSGLFQYLEAFYENKIPYKTFSIASSKDIKTNSGISISLDETIDVLKQQVNDFDAIVFSCGDAMIPGSGGDEKALGEAIAVLAKFNEQNKPLIGHCAAAIVFEKAEAVTGKKVAVHPYGKAALQKAIATDDLFVVDKNIYTAQCENSISLLLPKVLEKLKN